VIEFAQEVAMKKLLLVMGIVLCAGVLALGGEGENAQNRQGGRGTRGTRGTRGGRGSRGGRMGDMPFGNLMGQPRQSLAERLVSQMSEEDVPEELKQWTKELELIRLRLEDLDRKIQERAQDLMKEGELASLLEGYKKAAEACAKAVAENEEIKPRREQIAEIEKAQQDARNKMRSTRDWGQLFQTMREQRAERRKLEDEMAEVLAKDEGIQKLAKARGEAAAAFMAKHEALIEKDAETVAMKAEQKLLQETQREVERTAERFAAEKGLLNRGRRQPADRAGGRQPREGGEPAAQPKEEPKGTDN
jgi:hypothetical protein